MCNLYFQASPIRSKRATLQSLFAVDRSPSGMTVILTMQEMSSRGPTSPSANSRLTQFAEIVIRIDTGSPYDRSGLRLVSIVLWKIETTIWPAILGQNLHFSGNFERSSFGTVSPDPCVDKETLTPRIPICFIKFNLVCS